MGCNLKTKKLLDCVHIRGGEVIRSNTVILMYIVMNELFLRDLIYGFFFFFFSSYFKRETTLVSSCLLCCTPNPI